MIGYPSWWTVGAAGFPDIEKLLSTLFTPLLTGVDVVAKIPKPDVYEAQLSQGNGYLRFYRTGGAINYSEKRDEPRVQAAALTRSRDQSWELIEFTRQVLECFQHSAIVPGTTTKLACVGEVVGPQLIPELIPDDRLVPVTFGFYTWKPKGLPNYRQALGL